MSVILHWLTCAWLASPRTEIALSSGVLMCGQILLWRRRDNVLGYLLAGTYIVTILIPLYGTSVVADSDAHVVARLAKILMVGAGFYLFGLSFGGAIGNRIRIRRTVTFSKRLGTAMPPALRLWVRRLGVGALLLLLGSFALLGYVPALSADRTAAKYGVGIYAAGFARGSAIYHIALAIASVAIAVMLVTTWRRRTPKDLALCGALLLGLLLTLSREDTFSGPLIVLVALATEWRWKVASILAVVCGSLFIGTLANEFLLPSPPGSAPLSFAQRVAASAPDVHDQIGFLSGFETLGSVHVGTKTLTAGLTLKKGHYDPGQYSVRTLTLLPDASQVGSGGIRLPAPEWGYASYGWSGTLLWSFLSGLFAGLGTVVVRRLLDPIQNGPGASVNFVFAWVFYTGTFGILATFYFPQRVGILLLGIALLTGYAGRGALRSSSAGGHDAAMDEDEVARRMDVVAP